MTDTPLALARRSLAGLAVGDAFGETIFGEPREVARRVAKRLIATRRPWRWTDDTAMALSIVEVLGRHNAIDPDELAAAFARRYADAPDRGYGQGASALLTRFAIATCSSTEQFLWMTPRPPCLARAIAMSLSVTVSIGEETKGMLSLCRFVTRVRTSTSLGSTSARPGSRKTSRNVRATCILLNFSRNDCLETSAFNN